MPPANKILADHFGHRSIAKLGVERVLNFRITARSRIADDDEVGRGLKMRGVKAVISFDAQALKLLRHRRVKSFVRTGHAVALCLEHPGERSHRRAANSDQVKMFGLHQLW